MTMTPEELAKCREAFVTWCNSVPYPERRQSQGEGFDAGYEIGLAAAQAQHSESRWVQAGEIFRELQASGDSGVDMYALHQKYRHSPAMLSWFARTFKTMVDEQGGWLFLRHTPPEQPASRKVEMCGACGYEPATWGNKALLGSDIRLGDACKVMWYEGGITEPDEMKRRMEAKYGKPQQPTSGEGS